MVVLECGHFGLWNFLSIADFSNIKWIGQVLSVHV